MMNFFKRFFEKHTKYNGYIPLAVIQKYLPQNPIIIEAGAFDGSDTLSMALKWQKGFIYAFEPVPGAYQKLLNKVARLPNVKCYNLAVGDKTGMHEMHISTGPFGEQSSSLLAPKDHLQEHPDIKFNETINVSITTLDDWSINNDINEVDFLWLDMQGYELFALKASPKILQTAKVIYTEVARKELYEGCPLYPEVKHWLDLNGFKPEIEELAWEDAGNVLFIRK